LRAWRETSQQQSAKSWLSERQREFETGLTSLGHPELFGEPGKRTAEQAKNYQKAWEAHRVQINGLNSLGRIKLDENFKVTAAHVRAAVNQEFADLLIKNTLKQRDEKLRKQSARRTGGATGKTVSEPAAPENETPDQRARRMAARPEVQASIRKYFKE
jgi:hypothetical protein